MNESTKPDQQSVCDKIFQSAETKQKGSKILFLPRNVTPENIDQICEVYSEVRENKFETVVVVEPYFGQLDKAIPLISDLQFQTDYGPVSANEQLRDDFCDEEDDFFIEDEGRHPGMGVYDHLGIVKCFKEDILGVSVQLADERPAIVRELVYVLQEILAYRNALLVFCCDLNSEYTDEFEHINTLLEQQNTSNLMNYTFSGDSKIEGAGVFVAGVHVAHAWELEIVFFNEAYRHQRGTSLIAGSAGFAKEKV